jgi:aminoglycoside 3-N-acetyltransferase
VKRTSLLALASALESLRLPRNGVCVLHSSLLRLGVIEGGLPGIMACLGQVLGPRATLLMPTFTFSFGRTRRWDWHASKAETGALCEHLRRLPGTRRTVHPFHSLAVTGPMADAFDDCRALSSFGPGSPFDRLQALGAVNIGLGTDFVGGATFLHHAEEMARVPYRHDKAFPGEVRGEDGALLPQAFSMYVREVADTYHYENRWEPVWHDLVAADLVRCAPPGGVPAFAMDIRATHDWMVQRLTAEPYYCAVRVSTEEEGQVS